MTSSADAHPIRNSTLPVPGGANLPLWSRLPGLLDGEPVYPFSLINDEGRTFFFPSSAVPLRVKVAAGKYDARIHTPWGQIFRAKGLVHEDGTVRLRTHGVPPHTEALPWVLFRPNVADRLGAKPVTGASLARQALKFAFWTQDSRRWVHADKMASVVHEEFYDVEGHFFGRWIVRSETLAPLWFMVRGANLPSEMVALPPVAEREIVLVPHDPANPSVRVSALSREPISRALSAYIACADAEVVNFLFQTHADLPFDPAHFFFHLLLACHGNAEASSRHEKPLHHLAPHLADGFVAEAQREMSTSKPRLQDIRRLLLAGFQSGIPVWPYCLKQLHDGLEFISERRGEDEDVSNALFTIQNFVLASAPAVSLRFFATDPATPLFEAPSLVPEVGTLRPNNRKKITGKVVSTKMQKTIVVEIDRPKPHPIFKKIVWNSSKRYAHDESEEAREGDTVLIAETRPLSKLKRWRLVEIVRRHRGETHDRQAA